MPNTSLSSREFNQDLARAKRAAENGPVVITDRGKPSHVLLSYQDFQRLTNTKRDLTSILSMTGLSDIEFEADKLNFKSYIPDLTS